MRISMNWRNVVSLTVALTLVGCANLQSPQTHGHPALDQAVALHQAEQARMAQELAVRMAPSNPLAAGRALVGAAAGALIGSRFGAPGSQGQRVGVILGSAVGANWATLPSAAAGQSASGSGAAPLLGAVIGSRFGKGLGSAAGAVAGATLGAIAEGQASNESTSTETQK